MLVADATEPVYEARLATMLKEQSEQHDMEELQLKHDEAIARAIEAVQALEDERVKNAEAERKLEEQAKLIAELQKETKRDD